MQKYGLTWEQLDQRGYDDEWSASNGRFEYHTWKFGTIHQCCVEIDEVHIGLQCQKTCDDAMKHGVEWVEQYLKDGPKSVEQTFKECYERYPTIYKRRIEVIEHIFFVIGNGYDWLDGTIINSGPEDHLDNRYLDDIEEKADRADKLLDEALELVEKYGVEIEDVTSYWEDLRNKKNEDTTRPLPDDGRLMWFYPVSTDHSLICTIPSNVHPDWLELAEEAAQALVERSNPAEYVNGNNYESNVQAGKDALYNIAAIKNL